MTNNRQPRAGAPMSETDERRAERYVTALGVGVHPSAHREQMVKHMHRFITEVRASIEGVAVRETEQHNSTSGFDPLDPEYDPSETTRPFL